MPSQKLFTQDVVSADENIPELSLNLVIKPCCKAQNGQFNVQPTYGILIILICGKKPTKSAQWQRGSFCPAADN